MGSIGISNEDNNGLDLYRRFIEGGSYEIHQASEQIKRQVDSVFTPAAEDMVVYKGIVANYSDLDNLQSMIQSYSSTTLDRNVAIDYADRALDTGEDFVPIRATITVEKGTPIADTRKLLGTSGMKAYEKEITIGRNVQYNYSNLQVHNEGKDDEYYTVDIRVRRRK